MNSISKAVFPVAGLGSRFLPVTRASPKEMLPIVDKPLIQFAVEEAVEAGITQMIFVTGRNKRAIEDHFDKAYELETELEVRGKHELLESARSVLPGHASCTYVRQSEALGLGHAIVPALQAHNMVRGAKVKAIRIEGVPAFPIGWACRRWSALRGPARDFTDLVRLELRKMKSVPGFEVAPDS